MISWNLYHWLIYPTTLFKLQFIDGQTCFLILVVKSTYESQVKFSSLGKFREYLEFFGAGFSLGRPVYMEKNGPEFSPCQSSQLYKKIVDPERSRMLWLSNTAFAHALIASPWPRAGQNVYMEKSWLG